MAVTRTLLHRLIAYLPDRDLPFLASAIVDDFTLPTRHLLFPRLSQAEKRRIGQEYSRLAVPDATGNCWAGAERWHHWAIERKVRRYLAAMRARGPNGPAGRHLARTGAAPQAACAPRRTNR